MKHVFKSCPNCKKRIKITKYSWNNLWIFQCPFCDVRSEKVFDNWGGFAGFTLKVVK